MKRFFSLLMTSFLAILIAACGGGGGSAGTPGGSANPSNFKVNAPAEATLAVGQKVTYSISGGQTPYLVNNSAPNVATATVTGSTLEVTTLRAGSATVTVSPTGGGATFSIAITVTSSSNPLQVQAPLAVTLQTGNSGSYAISGGAPPYRVVTSAPGVVSASVSTSGTVFQVVAVAPGSAVVEIYDSSSSAPLQRTFTVVSTAAFFTSAPASVTMGNGTSRGFTVSGGVAPYFVSSSNSAVADASLSGGNLTIVAGSTSGSANIVLRDSGGSTLTIALTVGSSTAFFTDAPTSITIQGGADRTFSLRGGSAPYSVSSSNTRIVTATVSGATVTLAAQNRGAATVLLLDAAGASISIDVTVDQSGGSSVASIDLTSNLAAIRSAGEEATITATVKSAGNVGVANQDVIFTSSSGTLLAPAAQTDASGVATARLSAGSDRSNRTIVVTAQSASVSRTINVPVVGTTITVAGSTALQLGASAATYAVRALDSSGNAIVGATLTGKSALGNSISPSSLTTDVNGNASLTYTPVVSGSDTLTISGLGATGSLSVNVSNMNFSVISPAANSNVNVGANQSVVVRFLSGGSPVVGQSINFSTTRGALTPASGIVTTDINGTATVVVSSGSAGPAIVTAQIPAVAPAVLPQGEVTLPLNFVATTPATIQLQINPGAIAPNPTGQANQATIEATVRDSTGNAVSNRQVSFTIVTDPSNGSLQSGIALTDSSGKARTNFISGALSTPNNGVTVRADVVGTALSATANMTVSGNALFITIGFGNTIDNLDVTTYSKLFSVYVTDANGVAVGNQVVTLSVIPENYRKGRLAWVDPSWTFAVGSPTASCPNEDVNRNGILDAGEDTSANGLLTPGNVVVAVPGSVTTGSDGRAVFNLQYGEQFVPWIDAVLIARATVSGTESRRELPFSLSGLASDFDQETVPPAGVRSPFGVSAVCTDNN